MYSNDFVFFNNLLPYDSLFENENDNKFLYNCLASPFHPEMTLFEENHDNIEISTNSKSNVNDFPLEERVKSSEKESSNDDSLIGYYSFDKIQAKFPNFELRKNPYVKIAEKKLCNKKRQRDSQENSVTEENDNEEIIELEEENENKNRKKRGRKPKDNKGYKEHNNKSSDNIALKIKTYIFKYLLAFGNEVIKNNDKERLYKIAYKNINKIKKEEDLKLLDMEIQKILSLEISTKQKYKSSDYNKNLIEKIINKEKTVEDYDTTIFAFNMKLKDWLDLFLMKKNMDDLKNK